MKLATLLLVVAIAAAPTARAFAGTLPPIVPREATLVVSGDATLERDPDLARLGAEIVTSDDVASRSAGANATIYRRLGERLATLGIAGDAIRTTAFAVRFVPRPARPLPAGEPAPPYGYVTTRSLAIAIAALDRAGDVVDAALAAGITQIGDVTFDLKDREAVYREALGAAFADARANANAVVAHSEVRLAGVREISAGGAAFAPPRRFDGMQLRAAALAPAPPTQIDRGPIAVSAHVSVTYGLR